MGPAIKWPPSAVLVLLEARAVHLVDDLQVERLVDRVLAVRQRQRLLAGCVVRVADRHGTPIAFGCEGQVSGGVVCCGKRLRAQKDIWCIPGEGRFRGLNQRSYVTF